MEDFEIKPDTPANRAAAYEKFVEKNFEKIPYEPKPRNFMPEFIFSMHRIWTDDEINRKVKRLFFYGCLIFMAMFWVVMRWGEDLMAPRASGMVHRVLAGVVLLLIILNFIVEMCYLGGSKDRA